MKSIAYFPIAGHRRPTPRPSKPLVWGIICLYLGLNRPEKGMKFSPPSAYRARREVLPAWTVIEHFDGTAEAIQTSVLLSRDYVTRLLAVTNYR